MAGEIIPPGRGLPQDPSQTNKPFESSSSADFDGHSRFRIPVGVVLGLAFSVVLVVICGIIILYMSTSDRRIAGRLLDEQANAVLNGNTAALSAFFDKQEAILNSISIRATNGGAEIGAGDVSEFQDLLPDGAMLSLAQGTSGLQGETRWTKFQIKPGFETAVLSAERPLGDGRILVADYPLRVFQAIAGTMRFDGDYTVFILEDRQSAIAVSGLPPEPVGANPTGALPALESLATTPLHRLWTDDPRAHEMGGKITGRVFPGAERGMFTAIYAEMPDGPAKGWIVGALYRANQFGAALDQTRVVLYAAIVALVIGALLSFAVGRLLGRPLSRLGAAASHIRSLDFDEVERLPRSRLAELDAVNQAFNGSLGALNAFAKYVPRQLVRRLVEEGMTSSRNIETRDMTIVFTDLAGFTGTAAQLSAAETADFLNGYFETVSRAITARDGTIDKFLGDGVMAFWGAPSDQPDHAAKAIAAVLELAEQIKSDPDGNMRIRIGVHTGQVVVGDIGSTARMNYTVIGDAVNVAARLQEHGKSVDPHARVIALASSETMARLPSGGTGTSLGAVQLRGRDEPMTIFRIS